VTAFANLPRIGMMASAKTPKTLQAHTFGDVALKIGSVELLKSDKQSARPNEVGKDFVPANGLLQQNLFFVPASPRKSLKFQIKVVWHGRGCEFESRRLRHCLP
jgi:hypothetical protein